MKNLIFLAVLTSLIFAGQIVAQETSMVEVIKFNWSMYDRSKALDAPSVFEGETVRLPSKNNRMREKAIEEQSQDLRRVENAAKRSALAPPENIFYVLKVRNLNEKPIKSFIWEYQFAKESALRNGPSRPFLCAVKIKSGNSKTLRIASYLPPVNVVNASAPSNESKKDFAVEVLINRVEYADGTIRKRANWDNSRYVLDSPKINEKLKNNDCAAL